MLESVAIRLLQAVFGGGSDISAANPLPVDTSPGAKTVTVVLDEAIIAAPSVTLLINCDAINLSHGPNTLAITIKTTYQAGAVAGARVHVITSPTNSASGTHTAAPSATVMTDAAAHLQAGELVGLTIVNVTDGSSGVITANTETTVTVAALAGGTLNQWTVADVYTIEGADYDTDDWDTWNPGFAANTSIIQTKTYDACPMYVKVLIENQDAAQALFDTEVIVTVGA